MVVGTVVMSCIARVADHLANRTESLAVVEVLGAEEKCHMLGCLGCMPCLDWFRTRHFAAGSRLRQRTVVEDDLECLLGQTRRVLDDIDRRHQIAPTGCPDQPAVRRIGCRTLRVVVSMVSERCRNALSV